MSIQPIRRTRAYENIVQQLSAMIRNGELKPGERLPAERELAASFGVARPTLRQAITVLTQAGILEVRQGSGVYLASPVGDPGGPPSNNPLSVVLMTENMNLRHILELRIAVEGEAAYLAALKIDDAHVALLISAFEELERAFINRGVAIEEDYRFHCAVAEATGNAAFVKVMASLADLFMQGLRQTTRYFYYDSRRPEINRQAHKDIMTAIVERRPEAARAAMIHHLKQVFARLDQAERFILSEPNSVPNDRL